MPGLKKIDLSKIDSENCSHPDIQVEKSYLAKIRGQWHAGHFSHQWFGLNFDAVYHSGFQMNYKGWEELYEIQETRTESQ